VLIRQRRDKSFTYSGEIAHIRSRKPGGPRYDADYPAELVDTFDNVLAMCSNHHQEIDDDVDGWPVERLKALRDAAMEGAQARGWIEWVPRLASIHYANLTRLATLAALEGVSVELPEGSPRSPGWGGPYVASWIVAVGRALSLMRPQARRLTPDTRLSALEPGSLLLFDRGVRTLRGPGLPRDVERLRPLVGDLDHGPLVYFQREGYRISMPIDPQWITTQSSFLAFSEGSTGMAGLCQILGRDSVPQGTALRGHIVASPFVLGLSRDREPDLRPMDPKPGLPFNARDDEDYDE